MGLGSHRSSSAGRQWPDVQLCAGRTDSHTHSPDYSAPAANAGFSAACVCLGPMMQHFTEACQSTRVLLWFISNLLDELVSFLFDRCSHGGEPGAWVNEKRPIIFLLHVKFCSRCSTDIWLGHNMNRPSCPALK